MVNTYTPSTLNLAPENTANPDPVQSSGNDPPGPAPNPPVKVGRGGAAPGGGGRALGGIGRGRGGENPPQPPPGPPIGENPPNPMTFSLTPGGSKLGVLDDSNNNVYHHHTGSIAKFEEELYDCTPDEFHQFIKSLKVRAESYK